MKIPWRRDRLPTHLKKVKYLYFCPLLIPGFCTCCLLCKFPFPQSHSFSSNANLSFLTSSAITSYIKVSSCSYCSHSTLENHIILSKNFLFSHLSWPLLIKTSSLLKAFKNCYLVGTQHIQLNDLTQLIDCIICSQLVFSLHSCIVPCRQSTLTPPQTMAWPGDMFG